MEPVISYGTYYSYLKPKNRYAKKYIVNLEIQTFKDREVAVEFPESVRGKHVFIFGDSVNHLPELQMTVDAARRSSAGRITVVEPYYGYARQDKRQGRGSLGGAVMARTLEFLGVNSFLVMDLHSVQLLNAFWMPVDHISGVHLFGERLDSMITEMEKIAPVVLAHPDAGGRPRTEYMSQNLPTHKNHPFVGIDKHRRKANEIDSMRLIGDVNGKIVINIDDMVDTGGTMIKADKLFYDNGALDVYNVITHAVLSNNAADKLLTAGVKLITTNTRATAELVKGKTGIEVIDCSDIFLQAILNVADNKGITNILT